MTTQSHGEQAISMHKALKNHQNMWYIAFNNTHVKYGRLKTTRKNVHNWVAKYLQHILKIRHAS